MRLTPVACALLVAACAATETTLPATTTFGAEDAEINGPQFSADGSRVAYWLRSTGESGGWQLWVANADLTNAVSLPVRVGGADGSPPPVRWSPDGSKIASMSSNFSAADVVVVPSTGGDAVRLTSAPGFEAPLGWYADSDNVVYYASVEGGRFLTFTKSVSTGAQRALIPGETRHHIVFPSPTGSRLAVFVYDPPRSLVFVADSLGGNMRAVSNDGFEALAFVTNPWSPDGRSIVYESRRTGTADLWLAPADSGASVQLTTDVRNDFGASWSPDGNSISFISERGRQTDVWVVPRTGGDPRRVTDTSDEESTPAWRAGAAPIVTFTKRTVQSGLWALNLSDNSERRLTPDSVRVAFFNVSNKGDRVSVVIPRGGGVQDIVVVPLSSAGEMQTVVTGGTAQEAWWSPNDSLLTFASDRAGTFDVWVVGASGGTPRNVVSWPESFDFSPSWAANGTIVFQSDRTKPWGDAWAVDPAGGEPRQLTRTGTVADVVSRVKTDVVLAATVSTRAGELGVSLVNADGSVRSLWERSNVLGFGLSPNGDWAMAMVEQQDGRVLGTLLSTRGLPPRVVLKAGEAFNDFSLDGTRLLYTLPVGASNDLMMMTMADGTTRRLTTTPEIEAGAEFTPDGNTVVFRRTKVVQRIYAALLATGR